MANLHILDSLEAAILEDKEASLPRSVNWLWANSAFVDGCYLQQAFSLQYQMQDYYGNDCSPRTMELQIAATLYVLKSIQASWNEKQNRLLWWVPRDKNWAQRRIRAKQESYRRTLAIRWILLKWGLRRCYQWHARLPDRLSMVCKRVVEILLCQWNCVQARNLQKFIRIACALQPKQRIVAFKQFKDWAYHTLQLWRNWMLV